MIKLLNAVNIGNREKALSTYKQAKVGTASPGELVLMLYNGCLKNMREAVSCIEEKDLAGANGKLLRAQDIVDELRGSLNLSTGDLAAGLDSLYDFVYSALLRANLRKDTEPIGYALRVMTELRDAWEEAVRSYG